jgi:hypothetical protein
VITGVWLDWALASSLFGFAFDQKVAKIVEDGMTVFTATLMSRVADAE